MVNMNKKYRIFKLSWLEQHTQRDFKVARHPEQMQGLTSVGQSLK